MKYIELSRLLYIKSVDKTLTHYKFWGTAIILGLTIIGITFLAQQKLQNDQIELAQPIGPFVFEGNLTTLPTFGQTFVPRQAGLRGIYIPLRVTGDKSQEAALTLHLRTGPEATTDIRTVTLPLSELAEQNLARFSFEPLPDSFNTRYYFFLEPIPGEGEAKIELHYDRAAAYVDGALYIDGEPQDFQANFLLAYDRSLILLDWGHWFIKNSANLLGLVLLTILPGAALLAWLWPKSLPGTLDQANRLNHIEWLALASGLSVAVYPILLLLADVLGLKLGPNIIIAFLALNTLAIVAAIINWGSLAKMKIRVNPAELGTTQPSLSSYEFLRVPIFRIVRNFLSPPILLFWLIFILSAAVRIFIVRGQDVPLWQDSYHHTMISQLIVDNGGLFDSWAPYAPIESFTYHFGFHAFVTLYHWLTGSNIFQAVLATGQLLNLLTVPAAFLLGRRLGGNDWAGAFAALITGLLSEYPMFYVNWGRYTQLAGQVILPGVIILTWLALKSQKINYRLLGLTSLGLAGLALTHYRILLFYPCFVAPLLCLKWLQEDRQWRKLATHGLHLATLVFSSFILIIPWLWRVVGSKLLWISATITVAGVNSQSTQEVINNNLNIFDYVAPAVVILSIIAVIWGCWQRQEGVVITAGWGVMLLILSNPHFLNLPGAGIVTYFTILIAAYLPFSILAGFVLAKIVQALISLHSMVKWGIVLLTLAIGLAGAQERILSFEQGNAMITKPDLTAMTWVRENTPPDSTFWVNSRLAYGDTTVVGTDAGAWIPFLTGRENLLLPMTYAGEITIPADYWINMLNLYQQIHKTDFTSFEVWQILRQTGVTHIYIGQRRGEVWRGAEKPLDPVALQNSPYYKMIYRQDQVWIFEVCGSVTTTNCTGAGDTLN